MAHPQPWTANTCTGTCPCCCVIVSNTDSWQADSTRFAEVVQQALEFVDQYAEKEEIAELRIPVPRGPRPELPSDPAPRRVCEPYRVSRARPPPWTRPAPAGRRSP